MIRHRGVWYPCFLALAITAGVAGPAPAQQAAPPAAVPRSAAELPRERPEVVMWRALRSNPLTAPYAIIPSWKNGVVILSGRVGTKQVHDAAVQMAIAFGFRFRDDLVIDTAETFRAAMSATPSMTGYGALAPNLSASYYVYPQPLLGWLDDPFFGMEPPVVSFAPWTGNRLNVPIGRPNNGAGPMAINPAAAPDAGMRGAPNPPANIAGPNPGPGPGNPAGVDPWAGGGNPPVGGQPGAQAPGPAGAMGLPPAKGDIEITVDSAGQVFLRGVVASEEIAREIEQTAWSVPGVSRVVTQFTVRPRRAENSARDEPPPLPQPVQAQPDRLMVPPRPDPAASRPQPDRGAQPPAPTPAAPDRADRAPEPPPPGDVPAAPAHPQPAAPIAVVALDTQRLTQRVSEAIKRRPALSSQPIQVRTTGDAVMLSGKVSSAYEAMLAYRAAQQTPGVRDVVDRLEFLVPDEDHPNPLIRRGRPEDLEPYLTAQMTRHLGELAHIDSVRARGDHLEVRGTLLDAADKDRVLAILRSIPVLHGFTLVPTLTAD